MGLPDRLGPYRLLRKLGAGATGAVFLVEHEGLGATRALKVLNADADANLALRFEREGRAQAAVDAHPNVVRVHECGHERGARFLVMDFAAGGSLQERLRRGPLPPLEAARVVRDLARGLAHVHGLGVLHRDLKPENVLFDGETPKLVDFGLAGVRGEEGLTQTGAVIGTPSYMSPEQALGDRGAVSALSDVYGLGAVLYACLTGRAPFDGVSLLIVLTKVIESTPPAPSALQRGVPPALEAVCLKAMAKRPADRYPSARALADALDVVLAGDPPAPPSGARVPVLAAVVGAALVGGVLAAGWALTYGPGAPSPAPSVEPVVATPRPNAAKEPGLKASDQRRAREERAALETVSDPFERARRARSWLTAYAEHRDADRVRELLSELEDTVPLERVPLTNPGTWVKASYLQDGRLLAWFPGENSGLTVLSVEGGEARRKDLPLSGATHDVWVQPGASRALVVNVVGAVRWVDLVSGSAEVVDGPARGLPFLQGSAKGDEVLMVSEDQPSWVLGPPPGPVVGWPEDRLVKASTHGGGAFFLGCELSNGGGMIQRLVPGSPLSPGRPFDRPITALAYDPLTGRLAFATLGGFVGFLPAGDLNSKPRYLSRPERRNSFEAAVFSAPAHAGHSIALRFSPDGKRLYSLGRGSPREHKEWISWDLSTGRQLRRVTLSGPAHSLDVSPDGRHLCLGTRAGAVEIWSAD